MVVRITARVPKRFTSHAEQNAAHGAYRQAEQHDAHFRGRDGQNIANGGRARGPGGHQQTGNEEEHKQRPQAELQGFAGEVSVIGIAPEVQQ
jgi:hypothetical protein